MSNEQPEAAQDGPALLTEFIRTTPGMTQEKLGTLLGMHQAHVSKYCRGERRPRSAAIRARIEEISKGKVPASSWEKQRKPRRRKEELPAGGEPRVERDVDAASQDEA